MSRKVPEGVTDEELLGCGYPVAHAAGAPLPNSLDGAADVSAATVIRIEAGRLLRFISEMEPLQREVVRVSAGFGSARPRPIEEVASAPGFPSQLPTGYWRQANGS
jgi:hypothetical protein